MDGWLSWLCWLTDSGCFTHKVVTWPAVSLAHDRESSPATTGILTTMLRHQLNCDMFMFGEMRRNRNVAAASHVRCCVVCWRRARKRATSVLLTRHDGWLTTYDPIKLFLSLLLAYMYIVDGS